MLAQRRSELAIARQQLDDTTLRAPIEGVVRERLVFAGEYRAAGTPIVTVVRQHPLRLQLAVPERAATTLRVGQLVRVTVEGDTTVHEGRVTRVSPSIAEGTRTLPIEAEIPNREGKLRPGTFAKADIVTAEAPVAGRAADRRWSCSPASRRCWSSRTARPRNSACAPACASAIASRSSTASSAGDLVIVAPGGLADGSPVTIAE